MRLKTLIAGVAVVAVSLGSTPSRAVSNTFEGIATIELNERLIHGDPYTLEISIVELEMHLDDVSVESSVAVGAAFIRRGDVETAIPVEGWMDPPRGSGGKVWVSGISDEGDNYCFVISDAADAPTPRPDRIIAAFEPADTRVAGEAGMIVGDPLSVRIPGDLCSDLYYREEFVRSGDFSFSTRL